MPQMAPMWWSTLFIMFISLYLLYLMITYFMSNDLIKKSVFKSLGKKSPIKNWLW